MIHLNTTTAKLTRVEIALTCVPGCYLTDRPGSPIMRYAARVVWVPSVRFHFATGASSHTKTYHPAVKD